MNYDLYAWQAGSFMGEASIYSLGAIAPSHGERGSASLWWGSGGLCPQCGSGTKTPVRKSGSEVH